MSFDVPEIPVESIGIEEIPEVESSPDLPPLDIDGRLYNLFTLISIENLNSAVPSPF